LGALRAVKKKAKGTEGLHHKPAEGKKCRKVRSTLVGREVALNENIGVDR